MPIQVVCSGCKKRFSVSEKFAGKQGPCPGCKTVIKIPEAAAAEVTMHAPDEVRTKDGKTVTGQPTFKPIRRTHLTASPIAIVSIVAGICITLVVALFIGMSGTAVGMVILAPGAILLAVPLVWGGYIFLRDPELAAYTGMPLYIRIGIVSLVYVLLWGIWTFLSPLWGFPRGEYIDLPWLVAIVPALVCIGAIAPFAALDFEYLTAAFHYGLYLGVCVLLRVIMQLPPL